MEIEGGALDGSSKSEERTYLCIDLKSFYASVECADRGLDPFTTNLVVADPTRSANTICLAITPALKAQGVKNRCRLGDIPDGIEFTCAMPRMSRYMEVSANIVGAYQRFVSADDMHVYSIDESFIDATPYLKLYDMDAKSFARMLMNAAFECAGVTATAGIGTNLYLAKVAMDIRAKHIQPDENGVRIAQARYPASLYPGDIEFIAKGGNVQIVVHVYMEDYMLGVLPYEMDNSFPLEALKAQAVAARTYALKKMSVQAATYDVVDTTSDQVYNGTPSGNARCAQAVQ